MAHVGHSRPAARHRDPDKFGRGDSCQLFITAYADGSGRISMNRVSAPSTSWDDRLFGDERPFVAARLDQATLQAHWLGLFAYTLDESMQEAPTL